MRAWIRTIGEAEATGLLKQIYEELKEARGKVANIMKVHSLNPQAMKDHMNLYLTLMFGRSGLSRAERELIAVVVSAANECRYCLVHHGEALDRYWRDRGRVKQAGQDYRRLDLDERVRRILAYAVKLTRTPGSMEEKDVADLRAVGVEDADVLQLNLIVAYFNFVNRIALGLGVESTAEEVGGYKY